MRNLFALPLATVLLLCLASPISWAQKNRPQAQREVQRDLIIELRQVREGQEDGASNGGAYIVGTASRSANFEPQQVRVRNGEKASLSLNQSQPLQWVQRIDSASSTLSAASASASSQSGGVTQAVTWMESGQSLSVTPHWTGSKQGVKLEIEMLAATVDERTSSDLPATSRRHLATTVTTPLNQWVTLASSGKAAKPGSYSSTGSADARMLVQIRVTAD